MKNIRVVHIIDQLRIGGAQKLLVTFVKEAQRRSMPVEIVCLRRENPNSVISELEKYNAVITYLPAGKLLDPGRFWRLLNYIRHSQADLVQTHLTYANILGSTAAYLAGLPSAATLHLAGPDRRYSRLREQLETFCIRFFCRLAIAVGPETARQQASRLGSKKISVVLNAVELPPPVSAARIQEVRKELGINPDSRVFISVGRFSIVKAFHVLIEAFAAYHKQDPNSALVLVGDGKMRADWEQLAEDLGVSGDVLFTGLRDDVPDLLAASDLYVCSSTVEGTPLAVMEAISAGLPVVATNVGDLPVLIDPGFGILVEPDDSEAIMDAAALILKDTDGRQNMADAARVYASAHFSSGAWMDTLLAVYQIVLGRGRSE